MTDVVSPIVKPVETKAEPKEPDKQIDVIIEGTPEQGKDTPDIANLLSLDRYSEDNGQPYTADYLGIYFYSALTPELDVNGIVDSVRQIESYISEEIAEYRLTHTVGSYKEVMDRVKKAIGISENETIESKIDRIKIYINAMNEQKEQKKIDAYLTKTAIDLKSVFKGEPI